MSVNAPPIPAPCCRWSHSATPPHDAGQPANSFLCYGPILANPTASNRVSRHRHAESSENVASILVIRLHIYTCGVVP
jgi:hypothetical protein